MTRYNNKSIYKALLANKAFKVKTLNNLKANNYEDIAYKDYNNYAILKASKSFYLLKIALFILKEIKKRRGNILIVSSKIELKDLIIKLAKDLDSPYVSSKWPKGLLTNWETSNSNIRFFNLFSLKLKMTKSKSESFNSQFFGLQKLKKLPDIIIISDIKEDIEALKEAKALNIPVLAITDNSIDRSLIDYPIIINNFSKVTISLLFSIFSKALKNI